MKKSIILSFLFTIIMLSCRKSDNTKLPDLARVPTPNIKLDATSDKFIPPGSPASFKGKVIVDLKFSTDVKPQKFDLVVMRNGDKSNVKVLKADINTFPTTVDFTGQQLITLFGSPIADGDIFVVSVDITTLNGQKYSAFPIGGVGYGTGVSNEAGGVSTQVQFIKPCTFVAATYAGSFTVVSDEWQDYPAGTTLPVTMVSATQLSFMYNNDAGTAKPIILTINPANNTISVAKQEYGSYGGTKFFAEGVSGDASSVNPCDLSLSVKLTHTDAGGGNYGAYTIKLKKK